MIKYSYANNFKNRYAVTRSVNKKIKRIVNTLKYKILNKFKGEKLLNEIILESIEVGFSFGYASVRYYLYSNETNHLSIEAECKEYHKQEEINEKVYESVFYSMVDVLLPRWIEENKHKYKGLKLTIEEDKYGKYFEISYDDNWLLHIE